MISQLPTIGFDRFVELRWAEYALELGMAGGSPAQLKAWLEERIMGKDSARKTSNMLTNLWLRPFPETAHLRQDAFQLFHDILPDQRIALHWGMALANFRFFQNVAAITGRLLRLQGEFLGATLQQRLLEQYSNQGTIPRTAARVVQTFRAWNVIVETTGSRYQSAPLVPIYHQELASFLIECGISGQGGQSWSLSDALRMPELFPFDISGIGEQAIRGSPRLRISREGSNHEIVVLVSPRA